MSSTLPPPGSTDGVVPLPDGFRPVGIAHGRGQIAYVGSGDSGAIYAIDLARGQGRVLVAAQRGQGVLGLAYDARTDWLYAAGGATGNALIYEAATGAALHDIQLTTDPAGLVQDVAVTADAIFFTDAGRPVLYRLRLAAHGGLDSAVPVAAMTLGGDFVFVEEDLNGSGIVTVADERSLLVVHTALGALYRVDPATGAAALIDLGGDALPDSSGLVLAGNTLYVVNFNNCVFVVELDAQCRRGRLLRTITAPSFDNPSAAVVHDDTLCVVNARVATEATAKTAYWLTQIGRF